MPQETSLANKAVKLLTEIRKFLIYTGVAFILLTGALYMVSPHILFYLRQHLHQRLVFFGVMEPVTAHIKLAGITAILILMPFILAGVAQGLIKAFGVSKKFAFVFLVFSVLLFYGGATFCFFITLPYGINFLLSYQGENLKPVITIGKFVSFTTLFVLAFGLIFELPLIMTILCQLRLCSSSLFIKYRRYAVLIIAVLAAVLTPTPDVINMSLMGLPLYILYEAGIVIARLVRGENKNGAKG